MAGANNASVLNAAATYKIKRVRLFDGQMFQIVTQSSNGPCPLLAIANVLLLRGNIQLPQNAPDVSEERLVSLVAGWLLDRTEASQTGKKDGVMPKATAANIQQNISDAVRRLPKLTTGIDINPRFSGCQAYEFTDEVGIFDLLDIPLLHGWLVDPQDEALVRAINGASYNQLCSAAVDSLEASPYFQRDQLSQTAEGAKFTLDGEDDAEGGDLRPLGALQLDAGDGSFNERLQQALKLSSDTNAVGSEDSAAKSEGNTRFSARSEDSIDVLSPITPNSAAAKAFDSALVTPGHSRGHSRGLSLGGTLNGGADLDRQWHSPTAAASMVAAHDGRASKEDAGTFQSDRQMAAASNPEDEARSAISRLLQAVFQQHQRPNVASAEKSEAQLVREFLHETSQLTYHGLSELHSVMTPGQLAVFFRNNHFSTLTKHSDGSLYTLVTDQGYLREVDIVWERLATIDGDAQFVRADFSPAFPAGKSDMIQTAATGQGIGAYPSTGLALQSESASLDADLALALQLQEEEAADEENRRLRVERQRRQQQGQPNQQRVDRHGQRSVQPASAQSQEQRNRLWRSQQPPSQPQPGLPAVIPGQAPSKERCSIM